MGRIGTGLGLLALAGLLAGCAGRHHKPKPIPAPPATAAEPSPPAGAARGLSVPQPGADGHFRTINSGIDDEEAVWHLRAALNVAALACREDAGIMRGYNRLLVDRKPVLATAYAAETARFRATGADALDQHMSRLYNFFAQPPAQAAFCRAAAQEAARAATVPPAGFPAYAKGALDRLEAPILAFYRAYDAYRRDLASWKAHPQAADRQVAAIAAPLPVRLSSAGEGRTLANWRIQIGAFTGRDAAETAWTKARARVPGLAGYKPRYENVPGRAGLVRLQLGSADDRAGALRLCALAAAGGFDCLPIARR